MIKQLLTIALFFLGHFCAGQGKSISIPLNSIGDTTLWYKYQNQKFVEMGISNLIYSKDSLVLRFSTEIQAVEIRTADFKTFSGTLYNFTKKYVPDSGQQEKQNKLLFNKTAIDKTTARQIYETFKKLSIDTVPSQEQIKRWPILSDGMIYVIEYATPSVYSFKSYGEPWVSRIELKEAAAIDDLVRELKVSLQLYTSFDSFINSLPVGTYHAGGISLITTSKESKKLRQKSR